METKIFQPQTQQLVDNMSSLFPHVDFFKEWPTGDDVKSNIVGKNETQYVKTFTPDGIKKWQNEISLITLFNSFSKETWGSFTWPKIIDTSISTAKELYFVMENCEASKKMIDFSTVPSTELIHLYDAYRKEFDEFEKYTKWKTSTSTNIPLQKIFYSIKKIEQKIWSLEKKLWILQWATKILIVWKQKQQIQNWIHKWQDLVKEVILYDELQIFKTLEQLQKKIKKYEFEYNFGRFWTGHVFSDWKEHQLVDFDNVSYQIQCTELLWIIRSNVLLPVEEYSSYEERKNEFEQWHKQLLKIEKNEYLIKLQIFHKLLGTIFIDFGYLMIHIPANREKITKKWFIPEENAKKWIEWNYRLLQEIIGHY